MYLRMTISFYEQLFEYLQKYFFSQLKEKVKVSRNLFN